LASGAEEPFARRFGRPIRRGWTRLEVVGLFVILAIGAVVLWPVFGGARDITEFQQVAAGLASRLSEGHLRARSESRIYACYAREDLGRYRIGVWTGEAPEESTANVPPAMPLTPPGESDPAAESVELPPLPGVNPTLDKEYTLPKKVTFLIVQVYADKRAQEMGVEEGSHGERKSRWSRPILFYPDGTNTAARFVLSLEDEYFINVDLDPKTGEATPSKPYKVKEISEQRPPFETVPQPKGRKL
jgi:hypothetical protein